MVRWKEWGRIAQPKVHDAGDVCAKGGLEGCLVLVFFGYANIVISPAYVKLGK
jgi:hypothetical protein